MTTILPSNLVFIKVCLNKALHLLDILLSLMFSVLTVIPQHNNMEPADVPEKLQEALNQMHQLSNLVHPLQQGVTAATPHLSTSRYISSWVPISMTERYDGDPNRCQAILMHCELYLDHHPKMFLDDSDRIHF